MITLMNSFIINQTACLLLIKNINEYEIPVSVFNTDDPYFYIAKCIFEDFVNFVLVSTVYPAREVLFVLFGEHHNFPQTNNSGV